MRYTINIPILLMKKLRYKFTYTGYRARKW